MRGIGRRARAALNALGLRWKIAALLALGCAVVAVAIGVLVHQARLEQVSEGARSGATAQLVRVRQLYELTGQVDTAGDARTDAAIDAPGLPASLRTAALDGRRTTYLDMGAEHPVVWAARPVGGHVLSVRESLTVQAAEMAEFDRQLLASGAVVVILAALGGAALASRLSRELRTAAATARRISEGDLDARINHPRVPGSRPGKDEVAELAAAVDTMAASLQQRLEAEQRFTADVAHELRTPLTGLHTAAELLPQSRPTELVRDRVLALRTLTEDLLEVARLDAEMERPDLGTHPLRALTEGIVQRSGCAVRFAAAPAESRTDGSDSGADSASGSGSGGTLVRTDARRLERIIANLVANARRHGAGPVDVRVAGPVVTVSDHGPGFPAHLLEDGPRRFQTGARERGQGTGLGLTIAFGQAQAIGARVELRNAESGGAVATVRLPEA
ncbi:HAMP domain-containing sensor histidine kinase [Streptomyces sp. NPDC050439]|uniref:sensor histidine kinase n=1 Tax=unclassified Streptomyces TaxID=2593676 RepID=UPI00342F9D30